MNPATETKNGGVEVQRDTVTTSLECINPLATARFLGSSESLGITSTPTTPTLKTDVLGSIFKIFAGGITVLSGLGNFVWFNERLSNGLQFGEAASLGSIFCAMWAFCGRGPALATAALAAGSATAVNYINLQSSGLYPDQALSFFSSVGLCWALWGFQEELQRVSYESQDLDNPLESGTSVRGLAAAFFNCLKGVRQELNHSTQSFERTISKKLILGTLNASYLLCVSIISTIGGFFDPMLALFADNEERKKVAKELHDKTRDYTDTLVNTSYQAIAKNYLEAMSKEASGELSSGQAGKGPNYYKKAASLANHIGVNIADLDLMRVEDQTELDKRLIAASDKINTDSQLYKDIQNFLIEAGYTQHVKRAEEDLGASGGIRTFFYSPEQKADHVARVISKALGDIARSDEFFENHRQKLNETITREFSNLEAQAAGSSGQIVLPKLVFPEQQRISIEKPEFSNPTLEQKWNAWVDKFGGGYPGRSIAVLCLAANVITAASFEVILPLLNINWLSISNRVRGRINRGIDGIIRKVGDLLITRAEMKTYKENKDGAGIQWAFRNFAREFLESLKPDPLDPKKYTSPGKDGSARETISDNDYRSEAEALIDWYYGNRSKGFQGFSIIERIAMGRTTMAGQVQNKLARALFTIIAEELKQLSTLFGDNSEAQSQHIELIFLSVARLADHRDSSLMNRMIEFFLRAEASDKVLVIYNNRGGAEEGREPVSVKLELKYYQVTALWEAWKKTRAIILEQKTNALRDLLAPVARSWTNPSGMPAGMGPIETKVYRSQCGRAICGIGPDPRRYNKQFV